MKRPFLYWTATLLAVALAAVIAYFVGKKQADAVTEDIMAELEELRLEQSDAAVVKRVSQQMEDIAYLQKTVSEQERDRAEQQSELAMAMRDRAEQESRLARQAQSKAMEAAAEAEEQRTRALSHQKMAEEQRDAANLAKSISDTLNFRALGRTIGNSAFSLYENGNTVLASKLAYASWYFLNEYRGNTYQPETFNSLTLCSESSASIQTLQRGTVKALYPIDGVGCVTVTDYGEIEVHRRGGFNRNVVLHNKNYDFRDVWSDGKKIFALSHHGPLCETDLDKFIREIPLPAVDYIKLIEMPSGRFLIAATHMLLEMDCRNGKIVSSLGLDKELSTLVRDSKGIILFFADGSASRLNRNLTLSDFPCTKGKKVTAAYYDSRLSALFVGYENGDVDCFNRHDKYVCTIFAQTGRITDIVTVGNIMVSASYDKSVCLWNLPQLKLENNSKLSTALDIPADVMGSKYDMPSTEWATPVTINYPTWPLALCQFSPTEVVVGTASGEVHRFNVSADDMASIINRKYDVDLTPDEWDRYVGATVEYVNME